MSSEWVFDIIELAVNLGYQHNKNQEAAREKEDLAKIYREQGERERQSLLDQAENERLERLEQSKAERRKGFRKRARLEALYARRGLMKSGSGLDVVVEQSRIDELNIQARDRVSVRKRELLKYEGENALIRGENLEDMYQDQAKALQNQIWVDVGKSVLMGAAVVGTVLTAGAAAPLVAGAAGAAGGIAGTASTSAISAGFSAAASFGSQQLQELNQPTNSSLYQSQAQPSSSNQNWGLYDSNSQRRSSGSSSVLTSLFSLTGG